ncbi:MAG TPA: hypothetical protein VK680_01025 [Solirubrobacteraceae bacterium]|nr:hypothetical protein [Solirubrobacteraceae bacterium]
MTGLLFGDDPPLPAAGVDPAEDDPLELLGVLVTGASVTGAGVVVAAGETDVDSPEDSDAGIASVRLAAVLSVKAGAGRTLTLTTSMLIGGALLSATGIAEPAAAAGTLGSSRSAGAAAGRSARPIAKQQANTAAPASTDTSAARA